MHRESLIKLHQHHISRSYEESISKLKNYSDILSAYMKAETKSIRKVIKNVQTLDSPEYQIYRKEQFIKQLKNKGLTQDFSHLKSLGYADDINNVATILVKKSRDMIFEMLINHNELVYLDN